MRRFLIVTADDFGLHEAVNEAVELASCAGVLTAASLMVAAPAAAGAVRRAHHLPNLRVGLHVVLTEGQAALDRALIPDLVDRNGLFGKRMFAAGCRYFALPAVRRQLEAEIRAQFELFAQTGLVLDHVNAHKHFHLHPTLLEMLLRIGSEFGLRAMRIPREPLWFSLSGTRAATNAGMNAFLTPWMFLLKSRLRAAQILYNDQLFGMSRSGAMQEEALLRILGRLPGGITEIYLHPATQSGAAIVPSMSSYKHAAELAALRSPRVREAVKAAGIQSGGYQDVFA